MADVTGKCDPHPLVFFPKTPPHMVQAPSMGGTNPFGTGGLDMQELLAAALNCYVRLHRERGFSDDEIRSRLRALKFIE